MKTHYAIPGLDPPAVSTACGIPLSEGPVLADHELEVNCGGGCSVAAKQELKARLSRHDSALEKRVIELERDVEFLKEEISRMSGCGTKKKKHPSSAAALDEARRILKVSDVTALGAYFCVPCEAWHLSKSIEGKDERYVVRSD